MKRVLLTVLLALTLMSSVIPATSTPLSNLDIPDTIAWDLPFEEENAPEEGFEDERILTAGIVLEKGDGSLVRHSSLLNRLKGVHHWEVSAPPPR